MHNTFLWDQLKYQDKIKYPHTDMSYNAMSISQEKQFGALLVRIDKSPFMYSDSSIAKAFNVC